MKLVEGSAPCPVRKVRGPVRLWVSDAIVVPHSQVIWNTRKIFLAIREIKTDGTDLSLWHRGE